MVRPLWGWRTARYPCDFTGTLRAPRGNHAVTVRGPYECPTIPQSPYDFFDNISTENRAFAARSQCGVRTTPVRGLCNSRNDTSKGYGLTIFENLYTVTFFMTNRRGCDARESVRKPHGGHTEREIGQFAGSVDTSQAKCKLGWWRVTVNAIAYNVLLT